ncbi:MAG: DinB family protein [Ignavibacteria bacterium]|nr:DinB family protein [Ignavibacteria bacterium]
MTSGELLAQLSEKGALLTTYVNEHLLSLSVNQINWKPDSKHWSVAECLDHLLTSNTLYFPIIEKAFYTLKAKPEFQDQGEPFQYTLTGNMMIKMVRPDNKKKVQAPAQFLPSQPQYDLKIVQNFLNHHQKLLSFIEQYKGMNLNKVKVFSPVNRIFKFNVGDCFAMMIYHEERHVQQLAHLMEFSDYPIR